MSGSHENEPCESVQNANQPISTAQERKKEYMKQWRKNNPDKIRAHNRKSYETNRGTIEKCKARWKAAHPQRHKQIQKEWYERNRAMCIEKAKEWATDHPEQCQEYTKNWKKDNPQKARAHKIINDAVYRKKINKPQHCQMCGQVTPRHLLNGHHEDYSKPMDVKWLCHQCHVNIHQ